MNACELTAAVTAIANTIACRLTDDELSVLSAILVQLGDTLALIAAKRSLCCNKKNNYSYNLQVRFCTCFCFE